MNTIYFDDLTISVNFGAKVEAAPAGEGCVRIDVQWSAMTEAKPELSFQWSRPLVDIQYQWHPCCGADRSLRADWQEPIRSKISSSAPVFCFYNNAGRNRFTMALSDARTELGCALGVNEEHAELICQVQIPLDATGLTNEYEVVLYRSDADCTVAQSLAKVVQWWEQDCGMTPMAVPDCARLPLYSCWYSFHQATIASEIEAEAARAAKLGMKVIIVDDGWQTSDGNRGYGYCGDWRPTPEKIPDMRAHVANIHALGMKYVLWYSVPFVGKWSEHWDEFSSKLLCRIERMNTGVLDPRYPDVRQYLIDTYLTALRDWDLDGFKLDFIDSFSAPGGAPAPTPEMDFVRVEDAVLKLMTDVMDALRREKPDILIEFRQSYIGPAMRTFGNMLRVGDCPADYLRNRVGMADLRMLSGDTAVHSDMLMWHPEDSAENAARQILNILFAVPQISVRLDLIPEEHLRMLTFWMDFMTRHQPLLAAPMEAESPQQLYPLLRTRLGDEEAMAVYEIRHVARLSDAKTTYLFNATAETDMILTLDAPRPLHVQTFDCAGRPADEFDLAESALHRIDVPVSGYAVLH